MSQNKNDYIWSYNGNDYELDLGDFDTAKRFEAAIDVMAQREAEMQKDVNLSEVIKLNCEAYYEFFDSVFEKGTAEKIFGEKLNIRLCRDVYFNSFIPFVRNQGTQFRNYANSLAGKSQNRAQRRHGNNYSYRSRR